MCNIVACDAGQEQRVKSRPRLKHTAKPTRTSPVHQCRNFDDCCVHTRGPRGKCVDGVGSYSCDCDPGFRETDIDGDELRENLRDVVCIPNMSTFRAFRSLCVSLCLLARLYTAIHRPSAQTHLHASQAP